LTSSDTVLYFRQGKSFTPMEAASTKGKKMDFIFPLLASPKVEAIRCLTACGPYRLLSSKLKPLPNESIQLALRNLPPGLDGELIAFGDGRGQDYLKTHTDFPSFADVSSAVMTKEGVPSFAYLVSDYYLAPEEAYQSRIDKAKRLVQTYRNLKIPGLYVLSSTMVRSYEDLRLYHSYVVDKGFQGTLLREPGGKYKWGRSTLKEALLVEINKGAFDLPIVLEEAVILGVEEQMHDPTEVKKRHFRNMLQSASQDLVADAKKELALLRSAPKKQLLKPLGALGAFKVRDLKTNVEFFVEKGPLLTKKARKELWKQRASLVGQYLTYTSSKEAVAISSCATLHT
jgi:DNA ligase 1